MAIPLAKFGRTGHESTRVLFGAAALASVSQEVADQTLEVLLQQGAMGRSEVFVNSAGDVSLLPLFLDAASSFERRPSEPEMEELVARAHPQPLFV